MSSDLSQRPPLLRILPQLLHRLRPDDPIHVVLLLVIREPVPRRVQRGDFLALDEVQRVNARCTVAVGAYGVHVAQQSRISAPVIKLSLGI